MRKKQTQYKIASLSLTMTVGGLAMTAIILNKHTFLNYQAAESKVEFVYGNVILLLKNLRKIIQH